MTDDIEWAPPAHLPWMDDAACAQTDPDMFFPEKGGSTRAAKRICGGCDVQETCLEYALATGQQEGIWGGLSVRERRATGRMVSQVAVDYALVAYWVGQGLNDADVAAQVGCGASSVRDWRREQRANDPQGVAA